MKKLGLTLAVIAFTTAATFAQPAQHTKADKLKNGNHHHKKDMAFNQLNLTEDQKAQMKANREAFKTQMKALGSNENQTVKQLRDKRAALAQAQKTKMESILTADQKGKLTAMKAQAQQKHAEHSAKHLDKMKQALNLTDNQVATIKKNQEASNNKLKALKDNNQLSGAAKREQIKAMKDEMKHNMDNVLTKEQKEKLESRKSEMKHKMNDRKDRIMERKEVK